MEAKIIIIGKVDLPKEDIKILKKVDPESAAQTLFSGGYDIRAIIEVEKPKKPKTEKAPEEANPKTKED